MYEVEGINVMTGREEWRLRMLVFCWREIIGWVGMHSIKHRLLVHFVDCFPAGKWYRMVLDVRCFLKRKIQLEEGI